MWDSPMSEKGCSRAPWAVGGPALSKRRQLGICSLRIQLLIGGVTATAVQHNGLRGKTTQQVQALAD